MSGLRAVSVLALGVGLAGSLVVAPLPGQLHDELWSAFDTASAETARPTTLSLMPSAAMTGEYVEASGTVPSAGRRTVVLQRRLDGRWIKAATGETSRSGAFSLQHRNHAPAGSSTQLRVRAPRYTIGGVVHPAVLTDAKTLRSIAQHGRLIAPDWADGGDTVQMTAEFTPVRKGRIVWIQQHRSRRWTTVAQGTQSSTGVATIDVTLPAQEQRARFRAVAVAYHGASAAHTPEASLAISHTPVIETQVLPEAVIGVPYNTQLEADGPGSWSIAEGLPNGLAFDESTGALSGTPSGPAASIDLTVTFTNHLGVANSKSIALVVREPSTWTSLERGCGIHTDQTGWCWSSGLGPSPIQLSGTWKVLLPASPTIGIRSDGTGWWWGGSPESAASPTQIPGLWDVIDPGAATCGIAPDSTGWCWGENGWGQVGDGSTVHRDSPVQLPGEWLSISTSDQQTACGIQTDHTGWCWGRNSEGQLGDGTTNLWPEARPVPTQVPGSWKALETLGYRTCGIRTDNTAWCWGNNKFGQLGDGTTTDRAVPTQIPGSWKSLSMGGTSTCGISTDDTASCWGYNANAQLGDGSTVDRHSPVQLPGAWRSIAPGGCGIQTDDTGWCWGRNEDGWVGDGTTTTRLVPTKLPGRWRSLKSGCGIQTNGTGWCWGYNGSGEVGDGTTENRTSPVLLR
jgi:putative Ig domain-containing protein/regulator of chromosome condensation (RCC1) repeat-containing protein